MFIDLSNAIGVPKINVWNSMMHFFRLVLATLLLVQIIPSAAYAEFQKLECEIVGTTVLVMTGGNFEFAAADDDTREIRTFDLIPRLDKSGISFIAKSQKGNIYFTSQNFGKSGYLNYDRIKLYVEDRGEYMSITRKKIRIPDKDGYLFTLRKYAANWGGFIHSTVKFGEQLISTQNAVICEGSLDTLELGRALENS